jgi:hypothetical protein
VAGGTFPGVFIRAPRIRRIGRGVEVVARRARTAQGPGEPVGVRQGRIVGLCFHPELTDDLRLLRWFLSEVAGQAPARAASRAASSRARTPKKRARRTSAEVRDRAVAGAPA